VHLGQLQVVDTLYPPGQVLHPPGQSLAIDGTAMAGKDLRRGAKIWPLSEGVPKEWPLYGCPGHRSDAPMDVIPMATRIFEVTKLLDDKLAIVYGRDVGPKVCNQLMLA
jgi:hypothetical protein